mmetsp:Transcript_135841/g.202038  ORF Transcript_135841/g.202038 Transcript_135841/m.202038 type:complete len:199 (-) Transcript_135841:73-669(-)
MTRRSCNNSLRKCKDTSSLMNAMPLTKFSSSTHHPKQSLRNQKKKNQRDGTIEKDPDYKKFLEDLGKTKETVSAEAQLEKRLAEEKAANPTGEEAIISPLLLELKLKHERTVRKKRNAKKNQRRKQAEESRAGNANSNANKPNANKSNAGSNANGGNEGGSRPPRKQKRRNRKPRKANDATSKLVPGSIKIQQKPANN